MRPRWRSPYVAHAARVAAVASVVIGATYVCVVAVFDAFDKSRLVAQVDSRLNERLELVTRVPASAGAADNYDNDHDADDAPIFLWQIPAGGRPEPLTPGAPLLAKASLPAPLVPFVADLGSGSFRLEFRQNGEHRFIAGQSLAEVDHVESDLIAVESTAGPVLLLAVFFGTLLIGIKAASPVESARRRQLEFTADASHELRTPLSVIEAEVSLALSSPRSADVYRDTLRRVSRESLRLRDIVEDLLWLSRFDAEPPPPGDEPVDVSAVAEACADRFDAVARRKGITLSVLRQGGGSAWVNAPPEWIDRLTGVLVDNACRYAGSGGLVRITAGAQGNRVSLVVEDSGPGIAPEAQAGLFDRFSRATDLGDGAGLGLAIGDAVVRATGGEWRVGDAALGGARMEVRWHRSSGPRTSGPRASPLDARTAPGAEREARLRT
jgi:signal transduction histidine kinase